MLTNTGTTSGSLYYNGFDTTSAVTTGWYWACGPEIGTTFYGTNSLYPNANASNASSVDQANTSYYYNWARGTVSYEPNNQTLYQLSTGGDFETCLTTLVITNNTGKNGTSFSWNDKKYDTAGTGTWDAKGYFVEYGNLLQGDSGSVRSAFSTAKSTLRKPSGDISLTTVSWTGASTYTCGVSLPTTAKLVTISVDSGYFTIPSLGSALTFLGGTSGASYVSSYSTSTHFGSVVFSFTDYAAAATLLGNIVYSISGTTPQTISATSSTVSPISGDIYFEGHYYRYVDSGTGSISWPSSVLAAGGTVDPYFGGRGYIATATSQAENSILLRLVENGAGGSDHWDDAWMGGLWQRNTGTVASPTIIRGIDGNEITYDDVYQSTNLTALLKDYSDTFSDFVSNNASTFIYSNPNTIQYYWIDGPEAGEEIANNTSGFAPWHTSSGVQDEPNSGDFVYIGWQGAYWDDLSAGSSFSKLNGYIVEFSGYDGGSDAGVIVQDSKTTTVYTATVNTRCNGSAANTSGNVALWQSGSAAIVMSQGSTGVYTKLVHPGTYDVYINDEDTGKDITISRSDANTTVDYYTVAYSVSDAGTASESSVSATADGTDFASGTAILAGKEIVITAVGAGATQYAYAWSGTGISSGTDSSVTISSLEEAVSASCVVTGTMYYNVTIHTRINGTQSYVEGDVDLRNGAVSIDTVDYESGIYFASVQYGIYDVYIDGHDTGVNAYVLGSASNVILNYYTVSFSVSDEKEALGSEISATADGTAITSGSVVLAGKTIVITVIGAGATSYAYEWSQEDNQSNSTCLIESLSTPVNVTCTVTGTRIYTPTVTFDAEGGSLATASQVKRFGSVYGKGADGETRDVLPMPTRDGYIFAGWWTGYNGTGIQATDTTSISSASDHTLYAKWIPQTYTVTFLDWNGTLLETQTVRYEGAAQEPSQPSRTGYIFSGWDRSRYGIYADTSITAKYTICSYRVDFDTDGGSQVTSQVIQYAGKVAIPDPPTKSGYTFDGWYLDSTLETRYDFDGKISGRITLYAKWTPETIAVSPTPQPTLRTASIMSGESSFSFAMNRTVIDSSLVIDQAILSMDTVQTLIDQGSESDQLTVLIPEDTDDPADGYAFDVPSEVLYAIASSGRNTLFESPLGSASLSEENTQVVAENNTSLSISIMPAESVSSDEVSASLKDMTGRVLGTSIFVRTNIDSSVVLVTLPLDGLSEEELVDEAFLDTICIYVTYEDNTSGVLQGTIVYTDGVPSGICFEMSQSGSYQIISAETVCQKSEASSLWNHIVWIIVLFVVILLIGFFLILFFKRRKKNEEEHNQQKFLHV